MLGTTNKIGQRPFMRPVYHALDRAKNKIPEALLRASLFAIKWTDKLSPGFLSSVNINFKKDLVPYLEATKFFDYLATGIYVISENGNIVYANEAARSLFGMKGMKKANLMELFTAESVKAAFDRIKNSTVDDPREELILTMKNTAGNAAFPVETIPRKVRFLDGTYIVGGIKLSMVAAMKDLLEATSVGLSEEEVANVVIKHAMQLFKIDGAAVKIDFDPNGTFKVLSRMGLGEEYDLPRTIPIERTASYQAFIGGETIKKLVLNERTSGGTKYAMKSGIFVPLRVHVGKDLSGKDQFESIGTFCIYAKDNERFNSLTRNINYIEMFATIASLRIRGARLYEMEKHQKICKELLSGVAQAINSPLELKEVLEVLVSESFGMFGELKGKANIRSCSLYIKERGWEVLNPVAAKGRDDVRTNVEVGDGSVIGTAARTKKPICVNDAEAYFKGKREPGVESKGSFISIPILVGEELLGVLNISSDEKSMFDPELDGPVIKMLAEMAATAIKKAQIHDEIKVLLERTRLLAEQRKWEIMLDDTVPQLLNLGMTEVMLLTMFEEAKKTKKPLTVFFIDIDHFKEVNKEIGHPAATEKIRDIGRIISTLKGNNVWAGHFGGDEFLVMFYDLDKKTGTKIANKLREYIKAETGLGVTIGIANFPDDAMDPKTLLQRADTGDKDVKGRGLQVT